MRTARVGRIAMNRFVCWKAKRQEKVCFIMFSDRSDPNYRSPCIRVIKHNRSGTVPKFHDFRCHSAAWWLCFVPFDSDRFKVSHMCTSAVKGMSCCINPKHLRLESQKMNNERMKEQNRSSLEFFGSENQKTCHTPRLCHTYYTFSMSYAGF